MPEPFDTMTLLLGATASLAIVHTLLGVDHSLPFVALGRARGWTLMRTLLVTAVCGAGHVASSVAIGAFGVALGIATDALLWLESARGELAAALLIGFGLAYAAWAVWRRLRGREGAHLHAGVTGGPIGGTAGATAAAARVTPGAAPRHGRRHERRRPGHPLGALHRVRARPLRAAHSADGLCPAWRATG